jgi:hypothetical protein
MSGVDELDVVAALAEDRLRDAHERLVFAHLETGDVGIADDEDPEHARRLLVRQLPLAEALRVDADRVWKPSLTNVSCALSWWRQPQRECPSNSVSAEVSG